MICLERDTQSQTLYPVFSVPSITHHFEISAISLLKFSEEFPSIALPAPPIYYIIHHTLYIIHSLPFLSKNRNVTLLRPFRRPPPASIFIAANLSRQVEGGWKRDDNADHMLSSCANSTDKGVEYYYVRGTSTLWPEPSLRVVI